MVNLFMTKRKTTRPPFIRLKKMNPNPDDCDDSEINFLLSDPIHSSDTTVDTNKYIHKRNKRRFIIDSSDEDECVKCTSSFDNNHSIHMTNVNKFSPLPKLTYIVGIVGCIWVIAKLGSLYYTNYMEYTI